MAAIISHLPRALVVSSALVVSICCGGTGSTGAPAPSPTPDPAPSATPVTDAVRIVVLGDSIAAGLGVAETDAFPAVLQRLLRDAGHPVDVVNAGVSGDTSAGGLRRLDWILRQDPDVLVVELGANDALRGQPLEGTEDNLRQIVRRASEHGARVVLLGMDVPTNYGPEFTRGFSEIYPRVAAEEGAVLAPGFLRQIGPLPELWQPDGLHPTPEGQRRLAEALLPVIERALRETGGGGPGQGSAVDREAQQRADPAGGL